MKNKKERLQLIVNLIRKNSIGSQNELAVMLKQCGCEVTQARGSGRFSLQIETD